MSTQHTSGPWAQSIGKDAIQIISHADGEGLIADVNAYNRSPKGRANARLIAAAPTMLATLQTVLESMGDYYDAMDAAGDEGASLQDLVESTIEQATQS